MTATGTSVETGRALRKVRYGLVNCMIGRKRPITRPMPIPTARARIQPHRNGMMVCPYAVQNSWVWISSQSATSTWLKGTKNRVVSCLRPTSSQTPSSTSMEVKRTTHGNHLVSRIDLLDPSGHTCRTLTGSAVGGWVTPRLSRRPGPAPTNTYRVLRHPSLAPKLSQGSFEELKVEEFVEVHGCRVDIDLTQIGEELDCELGGLLGQNPVRVPNSSIGIGGD